MANRLVGKLLSGNQTRPRTCPVWGGLVALCRPVRMSPDSRASALNWRAKTVAEQKIWWHLLVLMLMRPAALPASGQEVPLGWTVATSRRRWVR